MQLKAEIGRAQERKTRFRAAAVRCHFYLFHSHYLIISFYAKKVNEKMRIFVMRRGWVRRGRWGGHSVARRRAPAQEHTSHYCRAAGRGLPALPCLPV